MIEYQMIILIELVLSRIKLCNHQIHIAGLRVMFYILQCSEMSKMYALNYTCTSARMLSFANCVLTNKCVNLQNYSS